MNALVEVPALPAPLRSINDTGDVVAHDAGLTLRAGPLMDWFIDPGGDADVRNAPALVMPAADDWMLRARVDAGHRATFDAAVLVAYVDDTTWAKLCLELAPDGRVMVVSVVTRGVSDDCNSVPVDAGGTWLRVSRLGRAFAFHWSPDGERWEMVRYFSLGTDGPVEVGFLAQSPTGGGCKARFDSIEFVASRLQDVRSGL